MYGAVVAEKQSDGADLKPLEEETKGP